MIGGGLAAGLVDGAAGLDDGHEDEGGYASQNDVELGLGEVEEAIVLGRGGVGYNVRSHWNQEFL